MLSDEKACEEEKTTHVSSSRDERARSSNPTPARNTSSTRVTVTTLSCTAQSAQLATHCEQCLLERWGDAHGGHHAATPFRLWDGSQSTTCARSATLSFSALSEKSPHVHIHSLVRPSSPPSPPTPLLQRTVCSDQFSLKHHLCLLPPPACIPCLVCRLSLPSVSFPSLRTVFNLSLNNLLSVFAFSRSLARSTDRHNGPLHRCHPCYRFRRGFGLRSRWSRPRGPHLGFHVGC